MQHTVTAMSDMYILQHLNVNFYLVFKSTVRSIVLLNLSFIVEWLLYSFSISGTLIHTCIILPVKDFQGNFEIHMQSAATQVDEIFHVLKLTLCG